MYGKKQVTSSKVSKRKKDGTYGNAYRKKTSYTCSGLGGGRDNLVPPSLVTLNASDENFGAQLLGVGRNSKGETLMLKVGRDYRAISEFESESEDTVLVQVADQWPSETG